MPEYMKGRAGKSGLPPGTLVHIGERKKEATEITLFEYTEQHIEERKINSPDEINLSEDSQTVKWINVDGIHEVDVLERLGKRFGLHPLVLEDIVNTNQRPKLEDFDEYIFTVAKIVYYHGNHGGIDTEQVSLVFGKNFVISFQEKDEGIFEPVRERLKKGVGRIRKAGADYLAYSLLDAIVDNYFVILEKMGETIEYVEDALVAKPTPKTLNQIHHLKREMLFLHRSVWPLREVVGAMERGESPLVQESTIVYLRDVYDHVIQTMDTTETYRDILSGMLDIYLSSISNRMNEVMKVLTIISTLFMPLTFIAGVYGMNFKYMPELEWAWGYPAVWLVMAVVTTSLFVYFKKKKWL